MENMVRFKYEVSVTRKTTSDFEFLGVVRGNSISDIKEKARIKARNNNKHGNRLYLECSTTNRKWCINS